MPVAFRGGTTCSCVATSLPLIENVMLVRGLISDSIDIYQLGYRNDVGASAGTHAGGGCTDVGQYDDAHLSVWRQFGWTMQHRTRAQGFDMDHGHGFPNGCPHLAPGAKSQQYAWNNGRNGLVSNAAIVGPGPIGSATPSWKTGVTLAKKELMAFADDVARKAAAQVLAGMKQDTSAGQVWSVGIPAPNGKGRWTASHLIDWMARVVGNAATKAQVDALSRKVDTLTNLVKKG